MGSSFRFLENVVVTELPEPFRRVIGLLQYSTVGLPPEVLAAAIASEVLALPELLAPLIQSGCVGADADRYRLMRRVGKVPEADERAVVVSGVAELLRYINLHHAADKGRLLVPDLIALTKNLLPT